MDAVILNPGFQPETAGSQTLLRRDIHVWAVPLWGEPERFLPLLSAVERERAERMLILDHRRRYTIAHGALRAILGGYTGEDPATLQFRTGPRGKPYLSERKDLFFNLSHSGQMALVALAHAEVGVDLEKLRHLESLRDIAQRHFSPSEYEGLSALSGDEQLRAFYRVWTSKEAFIKALGAGLSLRLDVFDVAVAGDMRFLAFRDREDPPESWALRDVSPGPAFAGALAIRGTDWQVRTLALQMA
jgi:4'-phosphopantetheinyl transferase